jgi:hypothetical protein
MEKYEYNGELKYTQVIQSDIGSDGMRYRTDRNPIEIFS